MYRGDVPDGHGAIALVWRQALAGLLAGVPAGVSLAAATDPWPVGLFAGLTFGLLFGLAVPLRDGGRLDYGLGAAALSIPAWLFVRVTLLPLALTGAPAWTPADMRTLLPELTVWLLAGATTGVLVSSTYEAVTSLVGPPPTPAEPSVETRIVILGGGFVGFETAKRLEAVFGPDPTVELTLVSETNAILFTPMLAEVAGGTAEPSHIVSPLRTSLRRTRVLQAAAVDVDFDARRVAVTDPDGAPVADAPERADGAVDTVPYDHLVLGLGSVPNYYGLDELREFAFEFKTLNDAIGIRERVVSCFERAERVDDPERVRTLVTFVVAGAGFAGAELAGAINDFARGMAVYYPGVPREAIRVVVVHSRDRILPELSDSLAEYARERMSDRGVEFELGTRVDGGRPGAVSLSNGEQIRARTLVWTAGNQPNPLVQRLDVAGEDGAVAVDEHLAVPDREGVWAAGDCAAVTDAETGERHPPTAQHAVRGARAVADNVHATVTDGELRPFSHRSEGTLAVIGHQVACAELGDRRFSGLSAWLLWRAVYLAKLPGLDRKVRVAFDWTIELFFPRDIVQTSPRGESREP